MRPSHLKSHLISSHLLFPRRKRKPTTAHKIPQTFFPRLFMPSYYSEGCLSGGPSPANLARPRDIDGHSTRHLILCIPRHSAYATYVNPVQPISVAFAILQWDSIPVSRTSGNPSPLPPRRHLRGITPTVTTTTTSSSAIRRTAPHCTAPLPPRGFFNSP